MTRPMELDERTKQEMMEYMREWEARARKLSEAEAPQIGVFYVIDGKVRCDGTYRDLIEPSPDGIRRWRSHEYSWRQNVQQFQREYLDIEEYHYPRGRINYSDDLKKYFAYLDWCLINPDQVDPAEEIVLSPANRAIFNQVLIEFNLTDQPVEILPSMEYHCARCRDDMWSPRDRWEGKERYGIHERYQTKTLREVSCRPKTRAGGSPTDGGESQAR